jgi:hypothetical protein
MTSRSIVGPALLAVGHLVAGLSATAERRANEAAALVPSSVCVVGELSAGTFESSGFVVPPGDYVLTTAHGIGPVKNLRVKLKDGRVFPARLERLGNERADVALLSLVGVRLEPAHLGSVEELHPGDEVMTIGCPLGFEFTVTSGVVSSVRPSDLGYPLIQTDVPVNPGSSGGPLFDQRGYVVGMIKSTAAGRDGIHFALPIDLGKALLEEVTRERRALDLFNQAVLEGRLDEKVSLYRQAIGLDPKLVEAHYNLALTLERLGRAQEAEAEYRETLRLRPDSAAAALNLGATLYGEQRFPEAIEVYRQALSREPTSIRLRNNLAEAYRAAGQKSKARQEFEAILKSHPEYAPAHYGLAVLLDDQFHEPVPAAEHYRRYLALSPEAADSEQVREWLRRAERAK